ncbi:MAG: hypothetical protein NDI61_02815 [Bdellovibrionaceae bacterium]|nr:hypothetical protein [Pseudobdellovibrionaceae bacterium]
MMFNRALGVLIALCVSFPQFGLAAIHVSGDEVTLETCGFTVDQVYRVTVQRTNVSQGGRTNERGCIKTTFREGKARAGDNLIIEVNGRRSSETVPGSGGGSTDPIDDREQVELSKVRQTAENQARFFANRVVIVYGSQENYRYNYYRGLRQGIDLYNWSTVSGVQHTYEFREGAARGQQDGASEGFAAGQYQGGNRGNSQGRADAFQRYQVVVDQNRAPDTELRIPAIHFGGLTASRSTPSMEDRLSQMESLVRSELGRLRFGDADYAHQVEWDEYWSPRTMYGWSDYRYDLVRDWYREDRAFDLYRRRALGGNYGSSLEYLERISDPAKTKNASEARNAYERSFKSEYNQVIDNKWRSAVTAPNHPAQTFGLHIGQQAAREHTREMGYNWAYATAYQNASLQSYEPAFTQSYRDGFEATVRQYEANAMLGSLSGQILGANGTEPLVIGAALSVEITRLVNYGRQNATVTLHSGSGTELLDTRSFSLGYSTSLQDSHVEKNFAKLLANPPPGQRQEISIRVGTRNDTSGLVLTQAIELRWDAQVVALARTGRNNAHVLPYVLKQIGEEWKEIDNTFSKNHYEGDARTKDTLLEQMVRAAKTLAPAERQSLQALKPELKRVFGDKPRLGGALTGKARKYKTAMALIDQI